MGDAQCKLGSTPDVTVTSPHRPSGLHEVSIVLARSLYICFVVAPSDDDYEEGMVLLGTILTFRGSGRLEMGRVRTGRRHWAGLPCSPTLDLTCMGSQSIWSMRST